MRGCHQEEAQDFRQDHCFIFKIPCGTLNFTWFKLMGLIADRQLNLSAKQASGLFMRMTMPSEIGHFLQPERCHQGSIAIGQGLLLAFIADILEIVFITLLAHAGSLSFHVTS